MKMKKIENLWVITLGNIVVKHEDLEVAQSLMVEKLGEM